MAIIKAKIVEIKKNFLKRIKMKNVLTFIRNQAGDDLTEMGYGLVVLRFDRLKIATHFLLLIPKIY